jgi:hypothetical protein
VRIVRGIPQSGVEGGGVVPRDRVFPSIASAWIAASGMHNSSAK